MKEVKKFCVLCAITAGMQSNKEIYTQRFSQIQQQSSMYNVYGQQHLDMLYDLYRLRLSDKKRCLFSTFILFGLVIAFFKFGGQLHLNNFSKYEAILSFIVHIQLTYIFCVLDLSDDLHFHGLSIRFYSLQLLNRKNIIKTQMLSACSLNFSCNKFQFIFSTFFIVIVSCYYHTCMRYNFQALG